MCTDVCDHVDTLVQTRGLISLVLSTKYEGKIGHLTRTPQSFRLT